MEKSNKEYYCVMPWHGAFYTTVGTAPCCSFSHLSEEKPITFLKGEELAEIKRSMLNGQVPKQCQYCDDQEKRGVNSTRITYQRLAESLEKRNQITIRRDLDFNYPEILEMRLSNLCNMACRICSPNWSNKLGKELQQNPNLLKYYKADRQAAELIIKNSVDPLFQVNDETLAEIYTIAEHAKHLFFTGGEPTIHKQVIDLLDHLIELGLAGEKSLQINTNCLAINPQILKRFSSFLRTMISVSIDGIGAVAEYQRYGTKWQQIDDNLKLIGDMKNLKNQDFNVYDGPVSVDMHLALSSYTVLDLYNTMEYYLKLYDEYKFTLTINTVLFPSQLNLKYLQGEARGRAKSQVFFSIDLLKKRAAEDFVFARFIGNSINQLENILISLESNDLNGYEYDQFVKYTLNMDELRDQSFESVFGFNLKN